MNIILIVLQLLPSVVTNAIRKITLSVLICTHIHRTMLVYFISHAKMVTAIPGHFAGKRPLNVSFDSQLNAKISTSIPHSCALFPVKFLNNAELTANRVVRTCAYERSKTDCYNADNDHHFETVCQCFSDGCNGADHLPTFHLFSTFIMAIVAHYLLWIDFNLTSSMQM